MFEKLSLTLLGILVVFSMYLMLVVMPVALYTEAQCLELGYPKFNVTIGLSRYCTNFEGAVTMKVKKL